MWIPLGIKKWVWVLWSPWLLDLSGSDHDKGHLIFQVPLLNDPWQVSELPNCLLLICQIKRLLFIDFKESIYKTPKSNRLSWVSKRMLAEANRQGERGRHGHTWTSTSHCPSEGLGMFVCGLRWAWSPRLPSASKFWKPNYKGLLWSQSSFHYLFYLLFIFRKTNDQSFYSCLWWRLWCTPSSLDSQLHVGILKIMNPVVELNVLFLPIAKDSGVKVSEASEMNWIPPPPPRISKVSIWWGQKGNLEVTFSLKK